MKKTFKGKKGPFKIQHEHHHAYSLYEQAYKDRHEGRTEKRTDGRTDSQQPWLFYIVKQNQRRQQ